MKLVSLQWRDLHGSREVVLVASCVSVVAEGLFDPLCLVVATHQKGRLDCQPPHWLEGF